MKALATSKDGQIESDNAIFTRLRKIDGLSLPEYITSFHLIDAETLVLVVAKAIECISGTEMQYSGSLPLNIASRHRVCTSVAAKVKELGFAGECGYNQLLYPIENQSRVLISWLVHRLPRGQDLRKEDDRNPAVVLNALITKAVIDWKSQGWHHPNCYYGVPPRNAYNIAPFQTLRMHSSKQSILDIFKESAELGISAEGSILEKHSLERIEESRHSSFLEGRLKSDFSDCAVTMKSTRLLANKHDCSRKSMIESAFCKYRLGNVAECSVSALEQAKLSIKIQLERSSCISAAIKALDLGDHEAEIARLEEEERAARVEVAALEEKFRATSGTLSLLESIASDLTSKMEFLEGDLSGASAESSELERKILVKRKTLEMIPFAHDNILKLEDDCAASIARATERTAEWDEERAALERKIQLKRSEKEKIKKQSLQQVEEINGMREEMAGMVADLKAKEVQSEALAHEVDSLPNDLTRAAYTYRILDIITSLNKQSKEIGKITGDIHSIQKVLNSTASALERADAVAEEMIFLAASADMRSHDKTESYRRLRTLRLQFNETVDTVGKIGQLEKLARDIETKIEEESGRLSTEAFRQISHDLQEIRGENEDLMMKIQAASVP